MRLIDEIRTTEPTWGYRTITTILRRDHGLLSKVCTNLPKARIINRNFIELCVISSVKRAG